MGFCEEAGTHFFVVVLRVYLFAMTFESSGFPCINCSTAELSKEFFLHFDT